MAASPRFEHQFVQSHDDDKSLTAEHNGFHPNIGAVEDSSSCVVAHESRAPELTLSPNSRVSRLPDPTVPSSPNATTSAPSKGAIFSTKTQTSSTPVRQDVHSSVKTSASSSSAIRSFGQQPSASLETSVSSSSQPSTSRHGLNQQSHRLRTPVFTSSTDLAAHYGIPQFLPPAPRTTPRQSVPAQQPQQLFDFNSLKNSYLNMLAHKPEEVSPATTSADTAMAFPSSAPVAAPPAEGHDINRQELEDLVNILAASPEFTNEMLASFSSPSMDPEQFLTSPMPALGHDFDEPSPKETPLHELLSTPLFDDLTSPLLDDHHDFDMEGDALFSAYTMPLFPEPAKQPSAPHKNIDVVQGLDSLIPFSPETPLLDSFAPLYPAPRIPSSAPTTIVPASPDVHSTDKQPAQRRRSNATGTRKGITPESLVPIDAPTQPRKYAIPSATSRKDLPAVFARKRARSQAFGDGDEDEQDELHEPPPGPNATEKEQIEWKRRQNTLAARKSRKRKLEHQMKLEDSVRSLTQERDSWKTRALTLQSLLVSHGIPFDNFRD